MPAQRAGPEWELIGWTRPGAAHLRAGRPNQDGLLYSLADGAAGSAACLVAADGHGSKRNFRSDRGAAFAHDLLRQFAGGFDHASSHSEANRVATIDLPDRIGLAWAKLVEADIDHSRFTDEELAALSPAERESVTSNPLVPYGSTLLGVLLTPRFAVYLQLGDGDILVVTREGEVTRPLPPDERSFANETASLCSGAGPVRGRRPAGGAGGWADFRVRFLPHPPDEPPPPALVLVSTDGYPNSFRSDADFVKVGTDLLEQLRSGGVDDLRQNLPAWLDEASRLGSGDDMTVGLIVGPAARSAPHATDGPPPPPDPARAEPCPSGLPTTVPAAASTTPAAPAAEPPRPWWRVW